MRFLEMTFRGFHLSFLFLFFSQPYMLDLTIPKWKKLFGFYFFFLFINFNLLFKFFKKYEHCSGTPSSRVTFCFTTFSKFFKIVRKQKKTSLII
jgi:hypothetical protein